MTYKGNVDLARLRVVLEQAERTSTGVQLVVGLDPAAVAVIECLPEDHSEFAVSVQVDLVAEGS